MKQLLIDNLPALLRIAAIVQAMVALLALNLEWMLGWRDDVARMPLLLREVFHVHVWFISLTLLIFAAITWRFAPAMARHDDEAAVWLAGAIGVFWLIRTVLQVTYYSAEHWRGRTGRTIVHVTLLAAYGAMSLTYGAACAGAGR